MRCESTPFDSGCTNADAPGVLLARVVGACPDHSAQRRLLFSHQPRVAQVEERPLSMREAPVRLGARGIRLRHLVAG